MSTLVLVTLLLTIAFAIIFNLTNGWNDAANAIATVVSTRVLTPVQAVIFGATLNFIGALFSSEVARTVGQSIADPESLKGGGAFLAAVMTAPIWITWCSKRGLPNSCSHALLGALIGSVLAVAGVAGLKAGGIQKILFGVAICPVAGFLAGHVLARIVTRLAANAKPAMASKLFGRLQLLSAGAMGFAHGTGDGQKAMGIITGALMAAGVWQQASAHDFAIPLWVRLICAAAMAAGTCLGGWHVMRTIGSRLAHLRTYQGFSAETAAATTILLNTLWGIPISTTHSITGAVMGVGAARGVKSVRWGVGRKIVFAWIVTFPVCILGGALVRWLLQWAGIP